MTNSQENAKDKAQELKDVTQETAQAAKEGVQASGDKAQETAQTASGTGDSDLEATKAKAREIAQSASGKAEEVGSRVQKTAEVASSKVETDIQATKEAVGEATPDVVPAPSAMKVESSAQDLKGRLDLGEPALTIVDVRSRDTYNQGHIMGAIPMPMDELVERAKSSLETIRDIYVYGESDKETAQGASQLREAGFQSVAELKGGLDAWKAIDGPMEGIVESQAEPGPQAYNVVSRLSDAAEKQ